MKKPYLILTALGVGFFFWKYFQSNAAAATPENPLAAGVAPAPMAAADSPSVSNFSEHGDYDTSLADAPKTNLAPQLPRTINFHPTTSATLPPPSAPRPVKGRTAAVQAVKRTLN